MPPCRRPRPCLAFGKRQADLVNLMKPMPGWHGRPTASLGLKTDVAIDDGPPDVYY